MFKMQETASQVAKTPDKDKREALEKHGEVHEGNIIQAYRRGIDLAEKTPSLKDRAKKIGEGQYYLTYLYMQIGGLKEAAELGEKVVRSESQTKFSPGTAGRTIDAYVRLMNNEKEAPEARKKLMDLADFIAKHRQVAWQGHMVLQVALYQHAMAACAKRTMSAKSSPPRNINKKSIGCGRPSTCLAKCHRSFAVTISLSASKPTRLCWA